MGSRFSVTPGGWRPTPSPSRALRATAPSRSCLTRCSRPPPWQRPARRAPTQARARACSAQPDAAAAGRRDARMGPAPGGSNTPLSCVSVDAPGELRPRGDRDAASLAGSDAVGAAAQVRSTLPAQRCRAWLPGCAA